MTDIEDLHFRLTDLVENMGDYHDDELRTVKNRLEITAMKIRIELLNRDARAIDEAANLKENDK